jgi:TIR domain
MRQRWKAEAVLEAIGRYLREGVPVEIEGFGRFGLDSEGEVVFEADGAIKVFIAYAYEDEDAAKRLSSSLRAAGFEPWLDQEKLLPGQNWPRAIDRAIEVSDFFIACLSKQSTLKRGHFQSELRYALDLASRVPLDDIFLMPVRLNDCAVPRNICQCTQYIDLFPDWDRGIEKIARTMRRQWNLRQGQLRLAG